MMEINEIYVFSDGGSNNRNNALGLGASAVVFVDPNTSEILEEWSSGFLDVNSARCEVLGMFNALRIIHENLSQFPDKSLRFKVYTDNQYCCNTITKDWLKNWVNHGILEDKAHADLWIQIWEFWKKIKSQVKIYWIRGHQKIKDDMTEEQIFGATWNNYVDEICTREQKVLKEKYNQ